MKRGAVVVLAGPDGLGKSSLVTAMKAQIKDRPVEYAWLRFRSLPQRAPGSGDRSRPHEVTTYPAPLSWLKLLYLFVDSWVGWVRRVRPMKRSGVLLMIDRGWWDMAVDPRRYKLRGSGPLVWLLGRLLPRPDLVVILRAPAAVILERKAELDAAELERQMHAWTKVLPTRVNREFLDADRALEEVAADLRALLRRRLGL